MWAENNKNKELFIGNARIEPALTQPDLGLYFSGDLKWNLHIDNVCGKANQVFQMIKRNVSLISSSTRSESQKKLAFLGPYNACRLIALNKNPGVRPISEVLMLGEPSDFVSGLISNFSVETRNCVWVRNVESNICNQY